jgi:hypothetical protein
VLELGVVAFGVVELGDVDVGGVFERTVFRDRPFVDVLGVVGELLDDDGEVAELDGPV